MRKIRNRRARSSRSTALPRSSGPNRLRWLYLAVIIVILACMVASLIPITPYVPVPIEELP